MHFRKQKLKVTNFCWNTRVSKSTKDRFINCSMRYLPSNASTMYKHLKYETWKNSSKTISISFKSSIYLLLIQNFQLKNHNPPLFERKKSYQTYLLLYISFGLSVIHKRVNNTVLFIVIFESKYMYFRSTENLMKQHSKRIFWRKKFLTLLCKVIFYRWKLFKIRHEMSIKQGWYKKKEEEEERKKSNRCETTIYSITWTKPLVTVWTTDTSGRVMPLSSWQLVNNARNSGIKWCECNMNRGISIAWLVPVAPGLILFFI